MTDSAKWQLALSNALQQAAVGFLIGGAGSFVVARSVAVRTGLTSLGAGFGIGRAYVDMRYLFNHDVRADKRWIATVTTKI